MINTVNINNVCNNNDMYLSLHSSKDVICEIPRFDGLVDYFVFHRIKLEKNKNMIFGNNDITFRDIPKESGVSY